MHYPLNRKATKNPESQSLRGLMPFQRITLKPLLIFGAQERHLELFKNNEIYHFGGIAAGLRVTLGVMS